MPEHSIHLVGGEADKTATLTTEERGGLCHIFFRYRNRLIEACATDYFDAFRQIRLQLEPERLIPFCYGASLNVFPSGMARDMGSGLKAYRLTIGQKALTKELVSIFDSGHDVVPASVANQEEYFNDWIQSLKHQDGEANESSQM
jgi:hypothetical protein